MIRTSGRPQELSDKLDVISELMEGGERTPIERLLFDVLSELLKEREGPSVPPRIGRTPSIRGFATLTSRERQILELVVGGLTNKQAARDLGISPRTVEVHRRRVMEKLGVKNTAALVRVATLSQDFPSHYLSDGHEEN